MSGWCISGIRAGRPSVPIQAVCLPLNKHTTLIYGTSYCLPYHGSAVVGAISARHLGRYYK